MKAFVPIASPKRAMVESDTTKNGGVGRNSKSDCKRIIDALVLLVGCHQNQNLEAIKDVSCQLAQVTRARKIVMYLAHVEWSVRMADVAEYFDTYRTSVSQACCAIEVLRDLTSFDVKMDELAALSGVHDQADIMIVKSGEWDAMSQKTRDAVVAMAGMAATHFRALK